MRAPLALVALALTLLAGRPAAAQSAESLIEEGIHAREAREDLRALELFRRAYDLEPCGGTLAQIALAEQALRRFVSAEAHMIEALSDRGDPFIRRNRRHLQGALDDIRGQIGELELLGGEPGAIVFLDGREVGRVPLAGPIRVGAGPRPLVVRLDGYEPFEQTVSIAPGRRAQVDVAMLPAAAPPDPDRPVPHALSHPGAPIQEMLLGLGGTAAVLGGLLTIGGGIALWVREDAAVARETCSDVDPECRDLYERATEAEEAAIALLITGPVLAGTGVALLLLGLDWEEGEAAAVACAPGLLSVGCAGRF